MLRLPLGIRLWHNGGPSKYELVLELLRDARNRLRRPVYVLFDAWYPPRALLRRIRDCSWYFVYRLKKNRRFDSKPHRTYRRHPYRAETGGLTGSTTSHAAWQRFACWGTKAMCVVSVSINSSAASVSWGARSCSRLWSG
jgi:hypothetical protein